MSAEQAEDPRPPECCGKCPGIVGGGYDCTCIGNEKCVADLIASARAVKHAAIPELVHRLADVLEATVREMHARELHHFETEEKLDTIWDTIGGILQTPPDGTTVREYRESVIQLIVNNRNI